MTLLDRFRTSTRDKHPDPAVRLAFVDELPLDERETIAAIAREDEEPRVRCAAVAKLMAPAVLAAILREDRDEAVRAQALAMLRDIALEAFEDVGEAESLEAVEEITDTRVLAQVAKAAAREIVVLRAVSRLDSAHFLGSVARHAAVEAARMQAVTALRERGERAELLATVLNGDFKDTALAAMDSMDDRATLDQIVARGRNKSAVKRARALLREADEQVAREAAEAAALAKEALVAAHPAVVEPESELASPPHGDPLAGLAALPAEPAAPVQSEREREERLAREHDERERAEAEAAAMLARRHLRLRELAEEAVAAASDEAVAVARKRFAAVLHEWDAVAVGLSVETELQSRFSEIHQRFSERDAEARAADASARRDALQRVNNLLKRVEGLADKPDLSLKAAENAARDLRTSLAAVPPLPTKQDFEEVHRRLKGAQAALLPKLQELRDADDWRRFGNVGVQEALCVQMEALKTQADVDLVVREVRSLQEQWRAAADVPRAQADVLWRRFKAAHDEIWARCEAHFAADAQARAENLSKKIALCEQAEARAESNDWIKTADEIKALQADWKAIGPVTRGKEKAIWDRFRAACDRFFTRRHEDLAQRKASWQENLAKKDALCVRAEALAESSDWDVAAAEIKKLQADWRAVGPVKKSKSDAIWQRFRAACDRFFARYAARHDTARAERIAAREAICAELEAHAAADDMPADLDAAVRGLRGRWQQEIAARGVDPDRARLLDHRFATAFAAVTARWPAAFTGTDLDPEANRKQMESLVKRIEGLAESLTGTQAADASLSPTNRLAAMLKEALAANTIGGKVEDAARFRAATEDVRQAQASWQRIGYVPDEVKRPLSDRFQRAARAITDRVGRRPA